MTGSAQHAQQRALLDGSRSVYGGLTKCCFEGLAYVKKRRRTARPRTIRPNSLLGLFRGQERQRGQYEHMLSKDEVRRTQYRLIQRERLQVGGEARDREWSLRQMPHFVGEVNDDRPTRQYT